MSMSQFNKWLKDNGVSKGPRCYLAACQASVNGADDAERKLRVTMSTRARDRHGDVLEPGGAQIAAFLKNPVVLWAHEHRALPIGRVTSLTRDGEALKAEILFAPTDAGREVYDLYAKGFLRAWSVGFLPMEWEVIEDKDGRAAGYHIRSWELIELSAVPVPANPEALTDALTKGLIREPKLVSALQDAVRLLPGDTAVAAQASKADIAPERDEPDAVPEVPRDLAAALAPKLVHRLRATLDGAVAREIRRAQGRLD